MAEELRLKGQDEEALAYYDKAISLIPQAEDWIYNNRGLIHLKRKNFAAALADFTVALHLKPNDGLIYNNRANAYFGLHQYQQAYADLVRAQSQGHQVNPDFLRRVTALVHPVHLLPEPGWAAPPRKATSRATRRPEPQSSGTRDAGTLRRGNTVRPSPHWRSRSD